MIRILLTCPPMTGVAEEMRPVFEARGAELVIPDFVQIVPEAELIRLVPSFDGWIIGDDPATAKVFEAGHAGRLRACVKWGVGVDNVDFDAARRLGLPISNTPAAFGGEVADIAMHYVTGLARETWGIDRGVRAGDWPKPQGISLAGCTVVLVGMGDIGRQTAKRLVAADMRVVAIDPALDPAQAPEGVKAGEWPAALATADFAVFTCPLNTATRHMLNDEALSHARPGLRVVNVARGAVIDEAALIRALGAGRVHSAALDVFEVEPLPMESPLRDHPRCIFGSHNASNTQDAVRRVSERATDLLFEALG